jgi:RimJ/RimL family protein N-acetyltransferase
MVELVRLSGYRLHGLSPEQMAYRWAALRAEVQKYVPLFQQLQPGYYLDDGDRSVPTLDLLMSKCQNGELYIVTSKQEFVGVAAITNIAYGRTAYIEAIAAPKYFGSYEVGKAFGELLTYAFNDYGEGGLGLKKVVARVVEKNIKVISMLQKAGFRACGVLQGEALCVGGVYAMILLEKLNPKFFAVETKVISSEQRTISTGVQPDQLRESSAPESSTVSSECAASSDGDTISGTGESDDGGGSELAEPEQLQRDIEPISTGRTGRSIRPEPDEPVPELVSAESSESTSGADVSPEPKSRRRVRV